MNVKTAHAVMSLHRKQMADALMHKGREDMLGFHCLSTPQADEAILPSDVRAMGSSKPRDGRVRMKYRFDWLLGTAALRARWRRVELRA